MDIVGCDWRRYLSDLHVPGEANEENEKSFPLLRLDRCLCLHNTSGTAEDSLGSDVSIVLKIAKHMNAVFRKYWCHICTCRGISSYQFTSNIPSEDENRSS